MSAHKPAFSNAAPSPLIDQQCHCGAGGDQRAIGMHHPVGLHMRGGCRAPFMLLHAARRTDDG
jgi:hypothetical protein